MTSDSEYTYMYLGILGIYGVRYLTCLPRVIL